MSPSGSFGTSSRSLRAVLVMFGLGLPALAQGAVEVTTIGPVTYLRKAGRPTVYEAMFPGAEGAGVMHLEDTRASLAVILLNGKLVAFPASLDPRSRSFDVPVRLKASNKMTVTLVGIPGSSLAVRVRQQIAAAGAAAVGAQGGLVRVSDPSSSLNGAALSIPAGALSQGTIVSIRETTAAPRFSDGSAGLTPVEIGPSGLTFAVPATLTLPYRMEDLDPVLSLGADTLGIFTYDTNHASWVTLPTEPVDTAARSVTTKAIQHLSPYVLKDATLDLRCGVLRNSQYLPVLLVHGLQAYFSDVLPGGDPFCGWGTGDTWGQLPDLLDQAGLSVCDMNYATGLGIEYSAVVLRRAVEKLRDFQAIEGGSRPGGVTVIAHSMGGLVARYALQNYPRQPEPIYQLVTLATPHLGTNTAVAGCTNIQQMKPGQGFLEGAWPSSTAPPLTGLNRAIRSPNTVPDLPSCGVDYSFFVGNNDWVVPQESALARNWVYFQDPNLGLQLTAPAAFEPPAIPDGRRLKVDPVGGCGPSGINSCTHTGDTGIASINESHVMWPRIRALAQNASWFSGPTPNCGSSPSNLITTVAGNGTQGFSGDSGPATVASLNNPQGVTVDGSGNILVVDRVNARIRRVNASTGVITTVAGNGAAGFGGDGGPAINASLSNPEAVAVDGAGNILIADSFSNRIRHVNVSTGVITTVAGNGTYGFSGDGGPALSASLSQPEGVAVDGSGNILIAETGSARIRRVSASTGIIATVAGNGIQGFSGDGGPATSASLSGSFGSPLGVAVDGSGNIFIADTGNGRIRRVNGSTGIITTVAGNGVFGFSGDGGPAVTAGLFSPQGVAVDVSGNIFIADRANHRIRRVSGSTGVITTVAGNGTLGFGGDGGPAANAALNNPQGVAVDASGNLFIADSDNSRVRKVR